MQDGLNLHLQPFHPRVFEVDISIFDFGYTHRCQWGCYSKIQNRMSNSGDPEKTERYKQSHLVLHCLQRYMLWSAGLQELRGKKYPFRVGNMSNLLGLPSEKGSTLKGKNLLPLEILSF